MAGSDTIFEPLAAAEAGQFAELESAAGLIFPDRRFVARVSRFAPAELPAVLTETREGRNRREMTDVAGNLGLPQYLRDLVQDFLAEETDPLTLYLNAANPAIQRLAARADLRDEVSRQALTSLYNNALMLLSRSLPGRCDPGDVRPVQPGHRADAGAGARTGPRWSAGIRRTRLARRRGRQRRRRDGQAGPGGSGPDGEAPDGTRCRNGAARSIRTCPAA